MWTILGVRFPVVRVASLAIALVLIVALQLFLRRTYHGQSPAGHRGELGGRHADGD